MAWQFDSTTGELSHNGERVGSGYSGHGAGLLNVHLEQMPDVGPIPRGAWTIGAFFDDPGGKGPVVAHLTPDPATNTFGRSGMMIHGAGAEDFVNHAELSSEGCIVLARPLREQIAASGDSDLLVV